MSKVKSFDVGNGDMFYIRHNSDNFTVIDCCLLPENQDAIIKEIKQESEEKGIHRFISTHPDEDHIKGLKSLREQWGIPNFYCVKNEATKSSPSESFQEYQRLKSSDKAYFIEKGCGRKWMNIGDEERGSSGIFILWPDTSNADFQEALQQARDGGSPNNISSVILYQTKGGLSFLWMGDLMDDFMEKISDEIELPEKVNVLFAPHHGRSTATVPKVLLDKISPDLIVIGSADSSKLHYYPKRMTITQNRSGDLTFESGRDYIDIYSSKVGRIEYLREKAEELEAPFVLDPLQMLIDKNYVFTLSPSGKRVAANQLVTSSLR